MKKDLVRIIPLLIIVPSLIHFNQRINAASDIEIIPNATEHCIKFPFEKSFRFIATIKNHSNQTKRVRVDSDAQEPQGWHILTATGVYELAPGEENDFTVVFEPGLGPQNGHTEEEVTATYTFEWEGGSEEIDVNVLTEYEEEKEGRLSTIDFTVTDRTTAEPIQAYTVIATLPSGIESFSQQCNTSEICTLSVTSGEYVSKVTSNYHLDHASDGYFLQVSAQGYQSYFETNYIPDEGENEKKVSLEPLRQVGAYTLAKTVDSGFSIWWIKASSNENFIAFSQGTHGSPDIPSPDQTKILLTTSNGEVLWEQDTAGECWALDVAPSGEYIAAGCHNGTIYVWDQNGDEVWTYENGEETQVRWVKFSPDSKQLITGPVESTPEQQALFDVDSGDMLWTFYTGGYLREARFSKNGDTVYLASGNGTLYAVDTQTGNKVWLGSGDYYIPFILGLSELSGTIVASGKGRAFTALDLETGAQEWQTTVDQTVTAGEVAIDGSIVGSTVGGFAYGISADGDIMWTRNYGGVGHNAVYYTKNGKYALFGGPNPTLFDRDGNILWQRELDEPVQMSGPVDIDTGAAYDSWMSEDAQLLILGGDDGKIEFYHGQVQDGENTYSQLSGMDLERTNFNGHETSTPEHIVDETIDTVKEAFPGSTGIIILLAAIFLICLTGIFIIYLVRKRKNVI